MRYASSTTTGWRGTPARVRLSVDVDRHGAPAPMTWTLLAAAVGRPDTNQIVTDFGRLLVFASYGVPTIRDSP